MNYRIPVAEKYRTMLEALKNHYGHATLTETLRFLIAKAHASVKPKE